MKLSRKSNRGGNLQLNMTPMIDCVFLLLIFFMSCTQISEARKSDVELPPLKGTVDQTETSLAINIDQDGDILINQGVYTLAQAATLVAELVADKGGNADLVKVELRVDRRSKTGVANQVVKALNKAKIGNVRFTVMEPNS